MSALKKFTVYSLQFTVSLCLLFFALVVPVSAQTPSPIPYPLNPIPSSVLPTSPIYTDLLVNNMFHTFSCLVAGQSIIAQPCLTYEITKDAQGAIQSIPVLSSANLSGGLLGTTSSLIGALYLNPPVKTADYLASLGEGLGIVKEAHAQVGGSGANVLNPILGLWQVSRNISYLVMIVIFVIIGLMVMFRQRINPQTVITAQAALPGLVIGLILITFSYFFAALLTDTAFIGTNLVGQYFANAQNIGQSNLVKDLQNFNVLSLMSRFVGATGPNTFEPTLQQIIDNLAGAPKLIVQTVLNFLAFQYGYNLAEPVSTAVSNISCMIIAAATAAGAGGAVGTPQLATLNVPACAHYASIAGKTAAGLTASTISSVAPGKVLSWVLYVILIAILIYAMFRLLLRLVNNFLAIIFYTITAPFHFLAASLPGRQGIATAWILNMLCNILAFPAVIGIFYFVNYILGPSAAGLGSGNPPFQVGSALDLTGKGALPLFGNLGTDFIRFLLAYGALVATPSIPDIICRAIGRVGQAGQLIGAEVGGGFRAGQQYTGRAVQTIQQRPTGIFGQTQFTVDKEGKLTPYITTPGLMNLFKGGRVASGQPREIRK